MRGIGGVLVFGCYKKEKKCYNNLVRTLYRNHVLFRR